MAANITSSNNSDQRKNWLITVEITNPVKISVTYIPHKLIADHKSLKIFLNEKANEEWDTPESMTLNIIENINNELVPKWLKVTYEYEGIVIEIEDSQPGFIDNK